MQASSATAGQAVPIPANLLTIPGVLGGWALQVSRVAARGPRIREVGLSSPELAKFAYEPGQDLMLILDLIAERALSRRYSIRSFDAGQREINLEIVLHDEDGPGQRWLTGVREGDQVSAVGPRGKITLNREVDWHLFLGDETFIPAACSMLEALPADQPALAFFEVVDATDQAQLDLPPTKQISWLHRGSSTPADGSRLVEALQGARLPAGRGQVYIAGEVQAVAAVQKAARTLGLGPEQMSPKAYWGRAKANGPHGEPDKVRD